ncbi:YcjF family protein [Roseomonas sp. 18066]|uniref:YcjF family protein n=1 Tax=Roseomonas sp. 18066 TaxID=2681412 RepID=UPI001357D667|nr:DUF697 domain-containing protein [Roseomonas sp. 18066]
MDHPASLLLDLPGLFLAVSAAALAPVEEALRRLAPDPAHPPPPPGMPHLLAEALEQLGRSLAGPGGFGEPQADLAAAALAAGDHPVPGSATLPELEGEVLARLAGPDTAPLGALALAVARLRHDRLRRAQRLGIAPPSPVLRRQGAVARRLPSAATVFDALRGLVGNNLLFADFQKQAEEERRRMGRVNILIAGKTGVGKSTLVNAVFGDQVALTGMGRPVTQDIAWYEPPQLPLRLCDTKGLEMADFAATLGALGQEIEKGNASGDFDQRLHVLWLCIAEPGARVEQGERAVVELCARHGIPALVILTKAIGPRAFEEAVRREIPGQRGIVRVLAENWDDRAPFGLDVLIQATERILPEARQAAFIAAQRVDVERKRKRAMKIAGGAAASAAAAAAVPIPLADAAGIFAINVGMVAGIAVAMGVSMDRDSMIAMAASLAGALATSAGGRMIAGQVLKLVPGIGSIAGGAITAAVAGSATYGLGYGFTEYLCRFHAAQGHMPAGDELRDGFRRFWENWKDKEKSPPRG